MKTIHLFLALILALWHRVAFQVRGSCALSHTGFDLQYPDLCHSLLQDASRHLEPWRKYITWKHCLTAFSQCIVVGDVLLVRLR